MVGFFMVVITGRYLHLTASATICQQNANPAIHATKPWGRTKEEQLEFFLTCFVIVPISAPGIKAAYAGIDDFSTRRGQLMGKNDLWIAATAHVTTATILTTDHDFDHLDPAYLTRVYVDPQTH